MPNLQKIVAPPFVEFNDLRGICRYPELLFCEVEVEDPRYSRVPWLQLGEVNLRKNERKGYWQLTAYLANATDEEEDSAYAMQLGIVDLRLVLMSHHTFMYEAWLHPDVGEFKVPDPGYDPRKHADAKICTTCEFPHPIVSPYVPPANRLLFQKLKASPLTINIGTVFPTDDGGFAGGCKKHKMLREVKSVSYCPKCKK
jgi:hypothetical protein